MDVTLLYKWSYDPEDAYIASDGSFRWKSGKLTAGEDDAAAIASARELAEATGGTLTGATIGNGDASWAAARGAQALFAGEGAMPAADDAATAEALFAVVQAAGPADVVAMADAIETSGVAPMLADMLGLPCVLGVRDFAVDSNEPWTLVAHRVARGVCEELRVPVPVLVSVSAESSEKNVPTMKAMLAARKTPKTPVAVDAHASGLATESIAKAALHRARIFDGTPDEAAVALVAALRAAGALGGKEARQ